MCVCEGSTEKEKEGPLFRVLTIGADRPNGGQAKTRKHTYTHTHIHTYTQTHTHTNTHAHTHMRTHMPTHPRAHTHTHTHTQTLTHTHTCAHAHPPTHTHTYTFTHTNIHMSTGRWLPWGALRKPRCRAERESRHPGADVPWRCRGEMNDVVVWSTWRKWSHATAAFYGHMTCFNANRCAAPRNKSARIGTAQALKTTSHT